MEDWFFSSLGNFQEFENCYSVSSAIWQFCCDYFRHNPLKNEKPPLVIAKIIISRRVSPNSRRIRFWFVLIWFWLCLFCIETLHWNITQLFMSISVMHHQRLHKKLSSGEGQSSVKSRQFPNFNLQSGNIRGNIILPGNSKRANDPLST